MLAPGATGDFTGGGAGAQAASHASAEARAMQRRQTRVLEPPSGTVSRIRTSENAS